MALVVVRIDKGKEQYDNCNKVLEIMIREIKAIIKTLQINQALDSQDEVDRESVFLMGLKDANIASNAGGGIGINTIDSPSYLHQSVGRDNLSSRKSTTRMNFNNLNPNTGLPGHQVISLDKNCLTCSSGGIPFAMNAFKIACLQYTPSVVRFEQGTLTRKQLIEMKGSILDLCIGNIDNYDTSVMDQSMRKVMYVINSQKAHANIRPNLLSPTKSTQSQFKLFGTPSSTAAAAAKWSQAGFDLGPGEGSTSTKNEFMALSKMKMMNSTDFGQSLSRRSKRNQSIAGNLVTEEGSQTERFVGGKGPIPIESDNPLQSLQMLGA